MMSLIIECNVCGFIGDNLQRSNHDCSAHMQKRIAALTARAEQAEAEAERERMRLAACGVAGLGYFDGCKDEYKSASLDDVLHLRERYEAEKAARDRAEAEVVRLKAIARELLDCPQDSFAMWQALDELRAALEG